MQATECNERKCCSLLLLRMQEGDCFRTHCVLRTLPSISDCYQSLDQKSSLSLNFLMFHKISPFTQFSVRCMFASIRPFFVYRVYRRRTIWNEMIICVEPFFGGKTSLQLVMSHHSLPFVFSLFSLFYPTTHTRRETMRQWRDRG